MRTRFGVPPAHALVLFVGRLDPVKGVLIAAEVVQQLAQRGHKVPLLVVGHRAQQHQVATVLGPHGTLTGNLPHHELARIYASADVLLFPSEAEVWPNVVIEARAGGLPVLACEGGARHLMRGDAWDGLLLPDRQVQRWLAATERLLAHPELLQEMGRRARQDVEAQVPSWTQVLEQQLMPV